MRQGWLILAGGCASVQPEVAGSTTVPRLTATEPELAAEPEVPCPDVPDDPPYLREVVGEAVNGEADEGPQPGAAGVVLTDLDGDGWSDLFVPQLDGPSRLLLGTGAAFVPADHRLDREVTGALGASAADADGDGDPDIVVYRYAAHPSILWNEGGWLVEKVLPVPDDGSPGCGGSAAWADYDLDGDLDLLLGRLDRLPQHTPCVSWLLQNDGTGRFTAVEGALSADVQRDRVMVASWLPLDDDPEPELYVVTDYPGVLPGNRVLDNVGGVLSQVDGHPLGISIAGMGVAVGDLDDDGRVDVFVPGIDELAMMTSVGDGLWVDSADAMGLRPSAARGQHTGWSGALEDLNNDGWEDLVVPFGPGGEVGDAATVHQPDEVFRGSPEGLWERTGAGWGLADRRSIRSVLVSDLDGNGTLDLVRREVGGVVLVDRARCTDSAWLAVRLHQPGLNPDAVGAQVVVRAGEQSWWRMVSAGSTGYASGGPPELHFGLGAVDTVDAIEVVWPDGERLELGGVQTRRRVHVHRDP